MKKLFICIFLIFISAISVNAQEIEALYLVKNVPQGNLANVVNNYFSQKGFQISGDSAFYILPPNSSKDNYYEVIVEQNGADCYLYYTANDAKTNVALVKELKKGSLRVSNIENPNLKFEFKGKAISLKQSYDTSLSNANSYRFDDATQAVYNKMNNVPIATQPQPQNINYYPQQENKPTFLKPQKSTTKTSTYTPTQQMRYVTHNVTNIHPQKMLKGSVMTIATGTVINASLQSAISSGSMSENDSITAVLTENFCYNGKVIFPKDSILYGTALNAKASSGGYGNGSLELTFNRALLPNGNRINISVDKISYAKKAERALNITRDVAAGSLIGSLGGLLIGAYTGDYANALILGAGLGAASGGIHSATQKGQEIEIPEGTVLQLRTNQPINISPYN